VTRQQIKKMTRQNTNLRRNYKNRYCPTYTVRSSKKKIKNLPFLFLNSNRRR
jgi:hypothetical protein